MKRRRPLRRQPTLAPPRDLRPRSPASLRNAPAAKLPRAGPRRAREDASGGGAQRFWKSAPRTDTGREWSRDRSAEPEHAVGGEGAGLRVGPGDAGAGPEHAWAGGGADATGAGPGHAWAGGAGLAVGPEGVGGASTRLGQGRVCEVEPREGGAGRGLSTRGPGGAGPEHAWGREAGPGTHPSEPTALTPTPAALGPADPTGALRRLWSWPPGPRAFPLNRRKHVRAQLAVRLALKSSPTRGGRRRRTPAEARCGLYWSPGSGRGKGDGDGVQGRGGRNRGSGTGVGDRGRGKGGKGMSRGRGRYLSSLRMVPSEGLLYSRPKWFQWFR